MPKSKEYVSTDEDSSEEEVKSKNKRQKRETKVAKKAKTTESNESEDTVWDLGNNRHVSVRYFKGKLYVDIREFYCDKDANFKPGKKGICLSMPQWQKFMSVVEEVDKAVKSKS